MPEESKKNQHKGPKDQRRPRNRNQAGPAEKKVEKKAEEPKVPVPQKPVYEEPGPEFYKNLKRETDEILKITEEANSKYKKKEIQSNWSKYEMPIESYDEIEEQENMGADYEKLIEAPLSVGGHFQFKHEKSWDVDTAPSLYDKYFEANMDNLFLSIATIPFHERINANKSLFSESDILTMNNRATRFKQKYYNDKSFTTPELTIQDNILSSLKENVGKVEETQQVDDSEEILENQDDIKESIIEKIQDVKLDDIQLENVNDFIPKTEVITSSISTEQSNITAPVKEQAKEDLDNFEDLILSNKEEKSSELGTKTTAVPAIQQIEKAIVADEPKETEQIQKNPVIESPEDLEKWLDDFLDG